MAWPNHGPWSEGRSSGDVETMLIFSFYLGSFRVEPLPRETDNKWVKRITNVRYSQVCLLEAYRRHIGAGVCRVWEPNPAHKNYSPVGIGRNRCKFRAIVLVSIAPNRGLQHCTPCFPHPVWTSSPISRTSRKPIVTRRARLSESSAGSYFPHATLQ